MRQFSLILNSRLSQANETLTLAQRTCVHLAMADIAKAAVETYKNNEAMAINKEAAGLIPSIIKGEMTLWIRNWYFKRAKKAAILRANTEQYKVYVIRCSSIAFKLLSTLDVDHNKKIKVLGKDVGAKQLTATASYVAYPTRKIVKPAKIVKPTKIKVNDGASKL